MFSHKRINILILMISLTTIFFSSSTIFNRIGVFEARAEAESVTNNESNQAHSLKPTAIELIELVETPPRFVQDETKLPIYLSFDDGPTEFTPAILTILREYQIPATFFMLSRNVQTYADTVREALNDGHTIGCHGVTHKVSEFYRTATSPREEMEACSRTVSDVAGTTTTQVRVPFGSSPHLSLAQKAELDKAGFHMWDWNVDSNDWKVHSPKQMIQSVLQQVENVQQRGNTPVLLFHDKDITVQSLPSIIEHLQRVGYEFKPMTNDDTPMQFKIKK